MSPAIVFTIISTLCSAFALIITFISIIIFLVHLQHTRDVVVLHLTTTYITILMFSIVAMNIFIKVLRADLYGFDGLNDSDLARCRLEGFMMFLSFGLCYMSFVLQAIHRLLRVIHPKHKLLQTFGFNILLIIIIWVASTLIVLPSHFWPTGSIYILFPTDFYCGIPYSSTVGIFFTTGIIYFSPVIYLGLIYARLIYFIRHHSFSSTQARQKLRMQRDFLVIRRIIFIVNALTLNGLPNVVFLVMTIVDANVSGWYYMYRIQWMIPCVGMFVLSIALIMITPQLKRLVFNRFNPRPTRVAPSGQTPAGQEDDIPSITHPQTQTRC